MLNQKEMSMDVFTLYPSRRKTLVLTLGSFAFAVAGMAMIENTGKLADYAAFAFFGLCTVVFALQLLPGAGYLTLRPDGFTACALFRAHEINWLDVLEFRVVKVNGHAMVGWNYRADFQAQAKLRKVAAAMSGVEGALADTYGMKAQQLADLLNQRRRSALDAGTAVRWAAGGIDLPSRWPAAQPPG
ncbi:MAG: STM3941 family protein [Pseudomonadota bacterium]